MFQSTLPQGERHSGWDAKTVAVFVSIHAPAGGATLTMRMEAAYTEVSIHAPAGGATEHQLHPIPHSLVSIHAPAGGATV